MKKILYVHGLGGSGNGRIATLLRNNLPEYEIDAPEIPIQPKQALEFIRDTIRDNDYDLLVGSSLGAYYLITCGCSRKKFLINPAIKAGEYIEKFIGRGIQTVNSVREDGVEEYVIDDKFIDDLKDMSSIILVDDEEYWITRCVVSPEDELFGSQNADICQELYVDHTSIIHSSHRVEDEVVISDIIPRIREFIEENIFNAPIMIGPYVDIDDDIN